MNTSKTVLWFILSLPLWFSGCAFVPNAYNDPRQGGLFGWISGEMRGDYDLREKLRRDRLQTLKTQVSRLRKKNTQYERGIQSKQQTVHRLRAKLQHTSYELAGLRHEIYQLENQKQVRAAQKDRLTQKLDQLRGQIDSRKQMIQGKIDQGDPNDKIAVEELQKQVDQLFEEYTALRARGETLFVRDPKF